jgi:hypothetical protein
MKPYTILFENGHKVAILDKTIEEVKERSGNFAKYGITIDGIFSSCYNMNYTTRKATEEEIQKRKDWIAKVEKEYQAVCEINAKVDRYNSAISKANNHHEFMNAASHLK